MIKKGSKVMPGTKSKLRVTIVEEDFISQMKTVSRQAEANGHVLPTPFAFSVDGGQYTHPWYLRVVHSVEVISNMDLVRIIGAGTDDLGNTYNDDVVIEIHTLLRKRDGSITFTS